MAVVGGILFVSYLAWGLYRRFRPKEKTYEDYAKQALYYEMYFRFKKAVSVYQKALELSYLTPIQFVNLKLREGCCLLKLKQYKEAVGVFDQAFENDNRLGPFFYTNQLKKVLKGYLKAGEEDKAIQLYEKLIKRSDYNPSFKKLKRWEASIYKND